MDIPAKITGAEAILLSLLEEQADVVWGYPDEPLYSDDLPW